MGTINQNANLYVGGKLRIKSGHYPKGLQPMNGNLDVMYIGLSLHAKNRRKQHGKR